MGWPLSPRLRGRIGVAFEACYPPPLAGEVARECGSEGALPRTDKLTVKRARQLRSAMTSAEVILWQNLRRRQLGDFRFRRQVPVGPYIADFACIERNLIVEVDGATHSEPDELAHDARRTAFLEAEGWQVCRIWNTEVYENLAGVLEMIRAKLEGQD